MSVKKLIALVVLAVSTASAFRLSARSMTSLRMCETTEAPEQTVTDLNLEEMQDMFEAADQADPTPAPKSAPAGSFNMENEPGITLFPKGFWDPAGLSKDVDQAQFKIFQEAETKHGRVCMLAFLGIFFGEKFPNEVVNGPGMFIIMLRNTIPHLITLETIPIMILTVSIFPSSLFSISSS
jgi:hypothetical protein